LIPIKPGRMQERPSLVQFSLSNSLVVSLIIIIIITRQGDLRQRRPVPYKLRYN